MKVGPHAAPPRGAHVRPGRGRACTSPPTGACACRNRRAACGTSRAGTCAGPPDACRAGTSLPQKNIVQNKIICAKIIWMEFLDRVDELAALEESWAADDARFFVLVGPAARWQDGAAQPLRRGQACALLRGDRHGQAGPAGRSLARTGARVGQRAALLPAAHELGGSAHGDRAVRRVRTHDRGPRRVPVPRSAGSRARQPPEQVVAADRPATRPDARPRRQRGVLLRA